MKNIVMVKQVVETWQIRKYQTGGFNLRDMRKWLEMMNALTKRLIHSIGEEQASYYAGLHELSDDANTILLAEQNNQGFRLDGYRTHRARELIRLLEVEDADFYIGLSELAMHACTLTTKGARVIADGVDRTNV